MPNLLEQKVHHYFLDKYWLIDYLFIFRTDFCEYVELCFWEFGDRVKNWITINEPRMFSTGGYLTGGMAPGRGKSSDTFFENFLYRFVPKYTISNNGNPSIDPYLVAHHQLLAHAAAVDLYRTKFQVILFLFIFYFLCNFSHIISFCFRSNNFVLIKKYFFIRIKKYICYLVLNSICIWIKEY